MNGKFYLKRVTYSDIYVPTDTVVQVRGGDAPGVTENEPGTTTGPTLKQNTDNVSFDGYIYSGTTTAAANATQGTVTRGENVVLRLFYEPEQPAVLASTSSTTPTYKVQYYIKQNDGSYKLYSEYTENGTAGSTVKASIISINGYEHVTISQSNESDVVKEDSSTILKVYYDKAEQVVTEEDTDDDEDIDEDIDEEDENTKSDSKKTKSSKTGDASSVSMALGMLIVSMILGVIFLFIRKRSEDEII